jgi:protein-disulfide isomerase
VPEDRLSKNQRREQARELARKEREKAKRRERLMKILIPVIVVVVLVGVGTGVGVAIATAPKPAPVAANGPKNMISDGIILTGDGSKISATATAGLKKGETPSPAPTPTTAGAPAHITTYVDWACPVCQAFEETNSSYIQDQVKSGKAVLQVMPVAIVDANYQSSRYASRANNAAACIANYDPDSFLTVQKQFYDDQPAEGSTGLTNKQINAEIKKAGVNDDKVTSCVDGESFKNWVAAATSRATSDPTLANPSSGSFGTPTVFVNGQRYTGQVNDAAAFKAFVASVQN